MKPFACSRTGSVRQGRRAAVTEPTPERLSVEQVQAIFDASPFLGFLQLQAVALDHDAGTLTVTMPMRPELERRIGHRAVSRRAHRRLHRHRGRFRGGHDGGRRRAHHQPPHRLSPSPPWAHSSPASRACGGWGARWPWWTWTSTTRSRASSPSAEAPTHPSAANSPSPPEGRAG